LPPVNETFAERLRRLREEHGLSISGLALEIGVSEGAIRQIESGSVKSTSFSIGLKLAHRLGVDPFYLALGEGSNLNERVTVLERRIAKLERAASTPSTRR
jgi:transcriptional regulator with XRE-family HTH domain